MKRSDPFKSPYNSNLYVGELKDEEEGTEYVVLVSGYATAVLWNLYEKKILFLRMAHSSTNTPSSRNTSFWSPRVSRTVSGIAITIIECATEFKSQTSPLDPSDLVQAYLLLRAARKAGKHIFAFYNCTYTVFPHLYLESSLKLLAREGGDQSGASQPHKHMQFLPTEGEDGPPIERLARSARIDKEGRYHLTFDKTSQKESDSLPRRQTVRAVRPTIREPRPAPRTVPLRDARRARASTITSIYRAARPLHLDRAARRHRRRL